jgi:hypothetical protein
VTAEVGVDRVEAVPGERLRGATPRVTCLPAAVEQQHRRIDGIAVGVRDELDAVGAAADEPLRFHQRRAAQSATQIVGTST